MAPRPVDVAMIGLGNWGTSLAAALAGAGIPLREVVLRRKRRSRFPVTGWKSAAFDARVLWLCVPDAAIQGVAEQIVRRRANLSGQIVVHSSGVLSSSVLEIARSAGAQIASAHPVMTFPTRDIVPLKKMLVGIETPDFPARRLLRTLIRRMGANPFDLRPESKALYHAAGTLASPLLVSAITAAFEAACLAGLDEKTAQRWVQALAEPTVHNVFTRGPGKSFSGPFARGDAGTIRLHLNALMPHPILAAVYRSLAQQAMHALPVRRARELSEALLDTKDLRHAGVSGRSKKQ